MSSPCQQQLERKIGYSRIPMDSSIVLLSLVSIGIIVKMPLERRVGHVADNITLSLCDIFTNGPDVFAPSSHLPLNQCTKNIAPGLIDSPRLISVDKSGGKLRHTMGLLPKQKMNNMRHDSYVLRRIQGIMRCTSYYE